MDIVPRLPDSKERFVGVESELKTVSVLDASEREKQGEKGKEKEKLCEEKIEEKRGHRNISFLLVRLCSYHRCTII